MTEPAFSFPDGTPATARENSTRSAWTRDRCAWLGYLIGLGWDAKRIAQDPLIRSTPSMVYQMTHRLGLAIKSSSTAQTVLHLPIETRAFYSQVAERHGLTPESAIRRTVIAMAKGPDAIDRLATALLADPVRQP